jgi:hypothetical protein
MRSPPRRISAPSAGSGGAYRIPKPAAHPRVTRLRAVAWVLDRSIPIGGGWRIGLDPLLGLIPAVGDWLGAVASLYIVYEAARLGIPVAILLRMLGNIAIETVLGLVPVIGDLFDFAWQANMRNLRLVERHYQPNLPARSLRSLGLILVLTVVGLLATLGLAIYALVKILVALFS